MHKLYKLFPKVEVCISNHTARPYRLAASVGIPEKFIIGYKEMLEAPSGWEWGYNWVIDGVDYRHGMETSGKNGALNLAIRLRQSCVIGHLHSFGAVQYHANDSDIIFGLNSGCLIDTDAYAFRYGKTFKDKPTIGCGVVLEGREAYFVPMDLGSKINRLN